MEAIQICECHLLPIMILAFLLSSLAECLMEWAMEKQWRRKNLKFISNDDIEVLNDYLEKDLSCFEIGGIVKTAYKKEEALRRIRKGWWKKLWKKDKQQQ